MSNRRPELIRKALRERLHELCAGRIAGLRPADFGAHAAFVHELQSRASGAGDYRQSSQTLNADPAAVWMEYDGGCLEALKRLSLGKDPGARPAAAAPAEPLVASLHALKQKPHERFRLLIKRYSCPLNIALEGEHDAREHILERLMVRDRARAEGGAIEAVCDDDVLLRLNLLAVHALLSGDLRYLDALNYYYELWPEGFRPDARTPQLYLYCLGLYREALSSWLERKL